jgi:hypothetical protein
VGETSKIRALRAGCTVLVDAARKSCNPRAPGRAKLTWLGSFSICCRMGDNCGGHVRLAGAALSVFVVSGCGGGVPLLHPAHVLPPDTVSAGAGVSGNFTSESAERRISRGRAAAAEPLLEPANAREYAEGILTQALVAPEASPWIAARVGLEGDNEAGLTYTGRSVRLDGRHVFRLTDKWGLSVGVGGTALLGSGDSGSDPFAGDAAQAPAEGELNATGWGADTPILVGYEGFNGFFEVWIGARAGFERVSGELRLGGEGVRTADAEGTRWWFGNVAGFSLGLPPLWFRFELATTLHQLSGSLRANEPDSGIDFASLEAAGWSLAPSVAIVGKF